MLTIETIFRKTGFLFRVTVTFNLLEKRTAVLFCSYIE